MYLNDSTSHASWDLPSVVTWLVNERLFQGFGLLLAKLYTHAYKYIDELCFTILSCSVNCIPMNRKQISPKILILVCLDLTTLLEWHHVISRRSVHLPSVPVFSSTSLLSPPLTDSDYILTFAWYEGLLTLVHRERRMSLPVDLTLTNTNCDIY